MEQLPTGTVTFLFTDLESSTRLWEEHPEAMKAALARHDEILRAAIETNGGHVVKTTGDGVHGAFATADDAVAAAVAAQRALVTEQWGPTGALRVRMGLHTGVAEQREGDYYGPALNRAARLMSVASAGQVLCSQATADLVRDTLPSPVGLCDLGSHALRDLARPEQVFQVTHPELASDFPAIRSLDAPRGNLPRQVTSFVGRDEEFARIASELEQTPVVTLTGVGGVGKTRLALECASRLEARYADGAWLVELAGVRETDAVADAVLDVFGLDRGTSATEPLLLQFLHGKELLLVLDNCEHLLRAVAKLVGELVRECPGVRILATSREGLNVPGERILVVASLDVPDVTGAPDAAAVAGIASSDAVRLFTERAQAVRSGFAVDASNAIAVAQICNRLDGVPLAIELAAARIGMLTPTELAVRLDQRFRVLTGSERGSVERHQTLRAAIDWSYDLLGDAERSVLARLSVFAGGFTLPAAEAVAAGGDVDALDVFDVLASLVARSLVVAGSEGSETRFRLLETIRQYAQERLDASGDMPRARTAHAQFYADFVERIAAGFEGPDEIEWLDRLLLETDNLRVALAWCAEDGDADTALRIMSLERGAFMAVSEIGQVIYAAADAVLAIPGIEEHPDYPVALVCAALRCSYDTEWEAARRFCDEAETAEARRGLPAGTLIWGARTWIATGEADTPGVFDATDHLIDAARAGGDRLVLGIALGQRAMVRSLRMQDPELAAAEIDEALMIARQVGAPTLLVAVLGFAAFALADTEPERARAAMEEAVRVKELRHVRSPLYSIAGDVAERLGERSLALEYFTRGIDEMTFLGASELAGRMLQRIGLLIVDDEPESSALITGAARRRSVGYTMTQRVVDRWEFVMAELDRVLGEQKRRELQARGAAMDDREAAAFARAAAARELDAWSSH